MAVKAAVEFIKAVARKLLVPKGKGITSIPNVMHAEAKAGEIAAIFQEAGLPINRLDEFIKSEKDVLKYLNIIESSRKQAIEQATKKTEKSFIELMQDKGHKFLEKDSPEYLAHIKKTKKKKDLPEWTEGWKPTVIQGSKGILNKIEGRMDKIKSISDELAKMKEEKLAIYGKKKPTEAEIKTKLEKQNKEAIERLKKKREKEIIDDMKAFEDPEDLAYGGIAGMLGEPTYADGGRVPLGAGKFVFDAARRKFLEMVGGAAAGVGVAKSGLFSLLKAGKPTAQVLTSVPIKAGVDGMPAWFKPLVNKVIKEGTDVTKELGTIERQLVHKTKLPNSKTDIYVTQDLNTGDVLVDIGSGKHGFAAGHHGQPVRLEYRAAEDIMTGPDADDLWKVGERDPHVKTKSRKELKTNKKPEEFWVEEAEFTGGHPENVKFEESAFEKFGEHGSDFSEVEKFATGKVKKAKPLKKREITEYEGEKAQADAERYWEEHGDYASGGRVPYFEGDIVDPEGYNISKRELGILANADPSMREMLRKFLTRIRDHEFIYPDRILDISRGRRTGEASGGRVPLGEGGIGDTEIAADIDKSLNQLMEDFKLYKDYGGRGNLKDYIKRYRALRFLHKEGGRVPLGHGGKGTPRKNYFKLLQLLDADGDMDIDEWLDILNSLPAYRGYQTGGRVPLAGGLLAKGIGKFTKSEVLIKMLEKTLKGSKDPWTKTNLPNFIKELKAKPELANDPQVWNYFTGKLPKNQRLVVHSDDTVDFWTQSDFGPHNIETTNKFMKTHPNLSRDEAVRIQNMEPEDQILEMKRLETIADRSRTKNASGGRVSLSAGGLAGMLGE